MNIQIAKYIRLILICILFCCSWNDALRAQFASMDLPESPGESIVLCCDRSIYGVTEEMFYTASYREPEGVSANKWSTVLYVELINWDGSKKGLSKVLIQDGRASGKIKIPGDLPSGVYYLRAYTKWMRNYSPYSYSYLPLRILNPFTRDKVSPPASPYKTLDSLGSSEARGVEFRGLKNIYGTREIVEFEIQLPVGSIPGNFALGIAKTSSPISTQYSVGEAQNNMAGTNEDIILPETNGLSLSGKVMDAESNLPLKGVNVQLSSFAHPFFYAEIASGKDGSFLFQLPHFTGTPELHISSAEAKSGRPSIIMASDYCNRPLSLPFIPLNMDSAEQSMVREILLNAQLHEKYRPDSMPDNESLDARAFYGSDASVIYVSDYIELSSLKEFIYEIIPQVSIRGSGKDASLSIQGPHCLDIYPSLVLMDNIPVENNMDLLNISSRQIERIEVLNEAYMVGNTRYSGILNVFSRRADLAGMEPGGEHHYFNIHLLDDESPFPRTLSEQAPASFPNIRNLLYWNPEVEFSEQGLAKVSFVTSDATGDYLITLHSMEPGSKQNSTIEALISVN